MKIKVPNVGESVTEAILSEWLQVDGSTVEKDTPVAMLETDKASMEVVAEIDGTLKHAVNEGTIVSIGDTLGTIQAGVKSVPSIQKTPPTQHTSNQSKDTPTTNTKEIPPQEHKQPQKASLPKKNEDLKSHNSELHLANIRPSARQQTTPPSLIGKNIKTDLLKHLNSSPSTAQPIHKTKNKKIEVPQEIQSSESIVKKPMSLIRKTIAKRLVESQKITATLTTFNEIDMSSVMQLRAQYKETFEKAHGVRLGFMGFFIKACVEAIKTVPAVNASIEDNHVIYKNFFHAGVAVSTDKGLLVPVIRHADKISIADIEKHIVYFADKARKGTLTIKELSGGTFTVSNGGVFGSLLSTPILNPPQSGILGLHKIEERPVASKGHVEVKPMMYVALSYDHRIIDGKESVTFLKTIKECMEYPAKVLLEI